MMYFSKAEEERQNKLENDSQQGLDKEVGSNRILSSNKNSDNSDKPADVNSQQPEVIACQGGRETSPSQEVVKSLETKSVDSGGTDERNLPADTSFVNQKESEVKNE